MTTNCCDIPTETCPSGKLERPRFFPRQLVTDADLRLGMDYVRDRLRLHNRMLHGWGVVCGLRVCRTNEPWIVEIKPGYALGPYGDEIFIDQDKVRFDLRRPAQVGPGVWDPFCSDVKKDPDPGPLYVAIKFKEIMTRPVRVQPVGCGCDDACEYSRWVDCYEFGVLDKCPDSHMNPPRPPKPEDCEIRDCPCCPDEPWVVLACLTVDDNGFVTGVDNCACRRIVMSFAEVWCKCADEPTEPPKEYEIKDIAAGGKLYAEGAGKARLYGTLPLAQDMDRVAFVGADRVEDVKVTQTTHVTPGEIIETVFTIAAGAQPGPRIAQILGPRGDVLASMEAFQMIDPPGAAPARKKAGKKKITKKITKKKTKTKTKTKRITKKKRS